MVVKLDVYRLDGTPSGEKLELPAKIFGIEPNDHVIWLAVTAEEANNRQGTAKAKTRSEVRGGGRKPWKQKGRGTARAGTIRSPLWVGGGRIFGPEPRTYEKRIPQKMKQLARRSALSYRAKDAQIRLIEDFNLDAPKTKTIQDVLNALQVADQKVLLLTATGDRNIWLSGRNIPMLSIRGADSFSTRDVLGARMLLIQKSAVDKIKEVLGQ
ncbi:MAG TPA: 50S ribosomal protein L4 [bacterium]|nr:50S ribosomal protein L4 [bacterium]